MGSSRIDGEAVSTLAYSWSSTRSVTDSRIDIAALSGRPLVGLRVLGGSSDWHAVSIPPAVSRCARTIKTDCQLFSRQEIVTDPIVASFISRSTLIELHVCFRIRLAASDSWLEQKPSLFISIERMMRQYEPIDAATFYFRTIGCRQHLPEQPSLLANTTYL